MAEAVMERVEVEAGAEEVFGFFSHRENACALVRRFEETRRVNLSESLWRFYGPSGRSADFGPDEFRDCLRHWRPGGYRGSLGEEMAGPSSSSDLILGDVSIECKALSAHKTLLFVSYRYADAFLPPSEAPGAGSEGGGASRSAHHYVNLHLHALVREIFDASWRGEAAPHLYPPRAFAAGEASEGSTEALAGDARTEEDRAWLEGDLSRLGEYGSYELTEEELADEQPIRYVPGLGLMVDDDGDGDSVG